MKMRAKELKDWRQKNGYSQGDLADALGIAPLTISRWERGDRNIPTFLHLALNYLADKGRQTTMNKKMLDKLIGKKVRLRPIPLKHQGGKWLRCDDLWRVEKSSIASLELANVASDHSKPIPKDHIREFMTDSQFGSDGILKLKSQIFIDGYAVKLEPI